jgi:outer membrane lipoprotein LolB
LIAKAPSAHWRWAPLVACAGLLVACASPSHEARPDALAGQLAVRIDSEPPRGVNAGFELSGSAARGRLVLSGPLGTTAAQARWAPGTATLLTGNGAIEYPDLDALAIEALGERIPIAALFDWLRGRAWSGAASGLRSDGAAGFEQLGWQISLSRFDEGWVEAHRAALPAITVRARVERP